MAARKAKKAPKKSGTPLSELHLGEPRKLRVLFWTADWCAPCQAMKKAGKVAKVCADAGVPLVLVDVEKYADESDEYSVQSMPTLQVEIVGVGVTAEAYDHKGLVQALEAAQVAAKFASPKLDEADPLNTPERAAKFANWDPK